MRIGDSALKASIATKQDTLNSSSIITLGSLQSYNLDVVASTSIDQSMSIIAGRENKDSILYLATPYYTTRSKKSVLIVEGFTNYSKGKVQMCLNNDSNNNGDHATISDSRFSIDTTG